MRFLAMATLSVAVLSLAPAARSEDAEEAEQHYRDGVAFFESGQFERASYHLDKAYERARKWQYLEHIARTWLALENYQNAVYALEAYLNKGGAKMPPDKREWAQKELRRLGELKSYQNGRQEALAHFKKAEEHFGGQEYAEAKRELEQANGASPTWEFLELMGRTEAALGNYAQAMEAYRRFLDESGENITGARRQSVKNAIADLETLMAVEKNRDEALAHFEAGRRELSVGEYDKAARTLELAYRLYPNWEFLEAIGDALAGSHSYRRAAESYAAFLEKGAGRVPAEKEVGLRREILRLNELAKGEASIEQSARFEQQGILSMEQRDHARALAQFQQAWELDPNLRLLAMMGEASEGLGRFREAIALYRRYLEEGGKGLEPARREAVADRIARLEVRLGEGGGGAAPTRVEPAARSEGPGPEAEGPAAVVGPETVAEEDAGGAREDGGGKRRWTWVVGGVGLASLAGAIATGAVASSEQKKIDEVCPGGDCPLEYYAGALDRQNTVNDLRNATRALLVVGLAGVVVGVALFFVEPRKRKKAEVSLAPSFGGGAAGLAAAGRF